jgi:PASTA domain-containing protein
MGPRKIIAALISLLALVVCASVASAEPLSMTFTEARAHVGVQLEDEALFAPPDTAPFAAQIDPSTDAISNGTLGVPDFETHIEEPIKADVTVDFNIGQITGSFDQATGTLSLTGVAGGTLTATENPTYGGEKCTVLAEPSPITLTTSGSSGGTNPRTGAPFAAGLAEPGAIASGWKNMSATPVEPGNPDNVSFCNNVEHQIEGPGGIWLEQKGVVMPPSPPASQSGNGSPSPPPPPACIVPSLDGKKLGRAKAELREAHCSVGNVLKPKHSKGRRRGAVVVKSSTPSAGTTLAAASPVDLKLGHRHHRLRLS